MGACFIGLVLSGLHAIVFTPEADEVRAFFRDTLGLSWVDAGGGWPIYAMPPTELAATRSSQASTWITEQHHEGLPERVGRAQHGVHRREPDAALLVIRAHGSCPAREGGQGDVVCSPMISAT